MFGVGLPEMAVITFVAVLVFGPDRLPDLARQAGQLIRKAQQFADAARDELRAELGPEYADLELRDLDPRTIVRKHIVEAMEDAERGRRPPPPRPAPARGGRAAAVRRRRDVARAPAASRPACSSSSRLCTAASAANATSTVRSARDPGLHEVRAHAQQHRLVPRPVDEVQHAPLRRAPPAGAAPSPSPEPGHRGPRDLGHRPVGGAGTRLHRGGPHHPVLRRAPQQQPAGATRSSVPLPAGPRRARRAPTLGPVGGHQPAGQRDLVVRRAAAVGELDVALGVVERLGLLLEVVEQREEVLLPAHGRNCATAPATDGPAEDG